MAKKTKNRGLGRGLSALMADVTDDVATPSENSPRRPDFTAPIDKIYPNPDQPRRTFTEDQLNELADSIREKGVIQPLIVRIRPESTDDYEIVAGERRWRASQMAGLHELPVILRDYSDTEVLEVAIIENIQRAELNPVEEAAGYRQLMDKFGHTQEKLSSALGKSRSHIANVMRLLNLPEAVQNHLKAGELTAGHARALIPTDDPVAVAQKIIKGNLSVRQAEALVKSLLSSGEKPKRTKKSPVIEKDADTRAIEGDLSASLGMKVAIDHKAGGESGQVTIKYTDLEQLDAICRILTASR